MKRLLLALALLGSVVAAASVAAAAPADKLVNIGVILDEPAVEIAIIEALDGRGYRIIRGTDLRARAAAEGLKPGQPPGTRALARSMGLSGIIGGVIRNQGGTVTAFVVVSDGSSGEIVARARWSAANAQKLGPIVRKDFWRKFGPSIRALVAVPGATTSPQPPAAVILPGAAAPAPPVPAVAPPTPAPVMTPPAPVQQPAPIPPGYAPTQGAVPATPAPVAQQAAPSPPPPLATNAPTLEASPYAADSAATGEVAEEAEEPAEEPEPTAVRGRRPVPLLEAVLGMRLHSRSFNYGSDPDDALANYRAAVAPGLAAKLTIFPLRNLVPLGLQVAGESTARIASELPGELAYDSRNVEAQGALVLQLASRWLVVDLGAGGGIHRFSFVARDSSSSRPRPIPDMYYRYLRGGVTLRVLASSRFNVEVGGFYRHVLDPGEIRHRDWFPRDKAFAIESSLGLTYRLTRQLEARAEGHLRRYQHKLNVQAGDLRNSDGAVDQHISAGLSLAWLVGAGPLR